MEKSLKAKKAQKLKLNLETLRNLDDRELQVVAGGATAFCTARCTGISCYC